jgi:hypothetical protein
MPNTSSITTPMATRLGMFLSGVIFLPFQLINTFRAIAQFQADLPEINKTISEIREKILEVQAVLLMLQVQYYIKANGDEIYTPLKSRK